MYNFQLISENVLPTIQQIVYLSASLFVFSHIRWLFCNKNANCKCALLLQLRIYFGSFIGWFVNHYANCEVSVCVFSRSLSLCVLLERVLNGWAENPNKININKLCMAYAKTKLGGGRKMWAQNDDVLFYDLMWFDVMWMVNLLTIITHWTMRALALSSARR